MHIFCSFFSWGFEKFIRNGIAETSGQRLLSAKFNRVLLSHIDTVDMINTVMYDEMITLQCFLFVEKERTSLVMYNVLVFLLFFFLFQADAIVLWFPLFPLAWLLGIISILFGFQRNVMKVCRCSLTRLFSHQTAKTIKREKLY